MGVIINSAVVPITLSMFWERLTGLAMIAGSVSGSILALIAWLIVSASYAGGLNQFGINASTCTSNSRIIRGIFGSFL
ncbi:hypothetical protein DPMN_096451 [Dreissena polymorpha]|uniref:Uncharacterized protein n=1 Tax=Dreissena polymorpha TaxID=45954 RepID=A0A9D4L8R0_DREPO|nr:hypothetical protein DPMN_096451 [Dreissena polymorpha]